jgi:hypothetical protein
VHQVFVAGQKAWESDLSLLDLQQASRRGLYAITREVRAASLASVTLPPACDHLGAPENCNQITFDIPGKNDIQFFVNENQELIRQNSSGAQRILASNIAGLYFCCAHGDGDCSCDTSFDILEIRLQAEKAAWGRNYDFSLRTKVKVRNE